jgi:O-succinylbenzoic acid--CoA ligase
MAALEEHGAGVVLGSGGSAGRRRWCVQPLANLQASAAASGRWLAGLGIDPADCLVLDPLPLHHVSGLLPLLRARQWGAELRWLPPALMRRPDQLATGCPLPRERPVLLSLVPTQLRRLMAAAEGLTWLNSCAVIWLGGASLPPDLAAAARDAALPLAPCYGATETAAMVCALPPQRFLAGERGCGDPLDDVELRLDQGSGAVEVRCDRLSPGLLRAGVLEPLRLHDRGWWRSGDGGQLGPHGLELLGRLDGAIHSGGETVFPEQLEGRLLAEAARRSLPLEALLLLSSPDLEWGQRLVALVRPVEGADEADLIESLRRLVAAWPPSQRPCRWHSCRTLAPAAAGKWQRGRWQEWLTSLEAD